MRKLMLAVALSAAAITTPALAGSITITVAGGAGNSGSKSYTLADGDVARLVAWAKAAYATPPTAPTVDVPNPPAPSPLTTGQALAAWVNGLVQGTIANVRSYEGERDRRAVADPTPISAN